MTPRTNAPTRQARAARKGRAPAIITDTCPSCHMFDGGAMAFVSTATLEKALTDQIGSIIEQLGHPTSSKTVMMEPAKVGSVAFRITSKGARGTKGEEPTVRLDAEAIAKDVVIALSQDKTEPNNPVMKTATEVFREIVATSEQTHNALREQEIEGLTAIFARRNHGDDPLVKSGDMIRENALQRARFLAENETLTSHDIWEIAGAGAENKSATAHRWKRAGKVFALPTPEGDAYPAFQIADGIPLPVVKDILTALPGAMGEWQIAFWFVSANAYLAGRRPVDCLADAEAVTTAARQEAEVVIG